jgi:hypothetical protein
MPANPLANADVPANHLPTAGMLNPETVKERRRAEKMKELRQYLVDAGVVEAVVKLFVGVLEQDYRPPEAPNLLKDFFGDYRDPLWDDIEQERTLIAKTKAENESLQQEVEELHDKVAAAERGYLGKQLHAAMLAKHPDQEILTGALAKAALVGAKPKPPLDVELPEEVDKEGVKNFLASLGAEDPMFAFAQELVSELVNGTGNPYAADSGNADLIAFLTAMNGFLAPATETGAEA